MFAAAEESKTTQNCGLCAVCMPDKMWTVVIAI